MLLWKATVAEGYHCPLCPNHRDETFYDCALFGRPICAGCAIELTEHSHGDERPERAKIDRVEAATGREWRECRVLLLREQIRDWERLRERPEEWPRTLRKPPEASAALIEERLGWLRATYSEALAVVRALGFDA
jgi:hypothetical protein